MKNNYLPLVAATINGILVTGVFIWIIWHMHAMGRFPLKPAIALTLVAIPLSFAMGWLGLDAFKSMRSARHTEITS